MYYYCTIQKEQECLATFFAMKQFSHYLLRCPFTIMLTLHHYTVVVSTRNGGVFVSGLWPYKNTHLLLYIHHKGTLMPPTRFTQVPGAITSTTEYTNWSTTGTNRGSSTPTYTAGTVKVSWKAYHCNLALFITKAIQYLQLWHHLSIVDGIVYHT